MALAARRQCAQQRCSAFGLPSQCSLPLLRGSFKCGCADEHSRIPALLASVEGGAAGGEGGLEHA